MVTYRQPGTVLTDLTFTVPLDHASPGGQQIELFGRQVVAAGHPPRPAERNVRPAGGGPPPPRRPPAPGASRSNCSAGGSWPPATTCGQQIELFGRQVVAAGHQDADRPWLLFLQGGPGFGAPRPTGQDSWLNRALRDYRVLLLDQRGTGRSSPANRHTLAALGSARAQADYLAHFRAHALVADAELVRRELTGGAPWSVLGQSFGGFCTVTYLSQAPEGVREAFFTGGLPGLEVTADDVYRSEEHT